MERQGTHSPSFKSIAGCAFVGLGILGVLGNLAWATLLRGCFCAMAGDALGVLPCLILAACQAAQTYILHHHGLLGWLQTLLAFWPVLSAVGGAI
jgi:hypothetical protein